MTYEQLTTFSLSLFLFNLVKRAPVSLYYLLYRVRMKRKNVGELLFYCIAIKYLSQNELTDAGDE